MALYEKVAESPLDNPITRRRLMVLAGQGGLGLMIAACTGAAATATPTRRPVKTTINAVYNPGIITADPQKAAPGGRTLGRQLYETPEYIDYVDFKVKNALATSVTTESDGNILFKLREGVKFHTGEEVTSEDFKYSIERIGDEKVGTWALGRLGKSVIERVDIIDKYSARVIINNPPQTQAAYNLQGSGYIMNKAWNEGHTLEELVLAANGTGPFKLTRFVPDQVAELEANNDWWEGAPPWKNMNIFINGEEAARLAMLQRGEADVMEALSPDLVQVAESAGLNVTVVNNLSPGMFFLGVTNPTNPMDPTQPNPFRDLRVRQALQYAIDREGIIKGIMRGLAFPFEAGWIPKPDMRGYLPPEELTQWNYDPDKAKQLLRDAGYPNGFKNMIHVPHPRYLKGLEISQAVADQLTDVGIETEIATYTRTVFVGKWRKTDLNPMFIDFGWPAQLNPFQMPDITMNNIKTFDDPATLAALAEAKTKLTIEDQDAGLRKLNKLFWENCPVLWMFQGTTIWGSSKDIVFPGVADTREVHYGRIKPA